MAKRIYLQGEDQSVEYYLGTQYNDADIRKQLKIDFLFKNIFLESSGAVFSYFGDNFDQYIADYQRLDTDYDVDFNTTEELS